MLVQSFHRDNLSFKDDFLKFLSVFGTTASIDQLVTATAANGMPLHLGWVHGDDDGQTPRPWHEKAIRKSCPHAVQ